MILTWIKDQNNGWFNLVDFDFSKNYFDDKQGVYVIWRRSNQHPNTVRLGQGILRDRLGQHQNDREILDYQINNELLFTWALVGPGVDRDRIEKYLSDRLEPLVGDRFPDRVPLEVNLPE